MDIKTVFKILLEPRGTTHFKETFSASLLHHDFNNSTNTRPLPGLLPK